MNHQYIPCPICHGGHKQPGHTTFTVDLGFGVVEVANWAQEAEALLY